MAEDEATIRVTFDRDTDNYHRYKLPADCELLFSRNYVYQPKGAQVLKRVVFEFASGKKAQVRAIVK